MANTYATHELTKPIINRRSIVGAGSPEGKRLSTLDAQLRNAAPAELINQTTREIQQIQAEGYKPPDFAAMIAEGRHLLGCSKGAM